MATERQAQLARDRHQDELVAAGATGLSVQLFSASSDQESFGVEVWVEARPQKNKHLSLPSSLVIRDRGKEVRVPVRVRVDKFRLE